MRVMTVDMTSPVPVYAQIMDRVRGAVREGALTPGMSLPSVRQLASDLEINPNTVAKAYMLLEREGIIRTIRRRGTYVADQAPIRARESEDERLERTLDRIVEETEKMGLDRWALLKAIRRRLGDDESHEDTTGGGSQ